MSNILPENCFKFLIADRPRLLSGVLLESAEPERLRTLGKLMEI